MSNRLVQVLPNGHLVLPPELHDFARQAKVFAVTKQDSSLLLTPVRMPEVAAQEDLLSLTLEQQAARRREAISRWQADRRPTQESKSRVLHRAGLLSDEDIPSDASQNFRDYLYGTQE